MGFAGFSIEIGKIAPQKNYGFSIEDNSNLLINLVDDQDNGIEVPANVTVHVDGVEYSLTSDSEYGLKIPAGNVVVTVNESSTHLGKVLDPFTHDGSEIVKIDVQLRKDAKYYVIPKLGDLSGKQSNIANLQYP